MFEEMLNGSLIDVLEEKRTLVFLHCHSTWLVQTECQLETESKCLGDSVLGVDQYLRGLRQSPSESAKQALEPEHQTKRQRKPSNIHVQFWIEDARKEQ